MDISSINSDLIRGNVTTIILTSLWSADRYGYDILKEIETHSEGQYNLKQATLYNQLKRLEKQGLISSYDGDPDDTGGGKRRYFTLTAEGRQFLEQQKTEYEYARTILDGLISDQKYDFTKPPPFKADELRPYALHDKEEKPKVVYKDKIVEKKVYFDLQGNEISEEEFMALKEQQAIEAAKPQPVKTIDEVFAELDAQKTAAPQQVEEKQEDATQAKLDEIFSKYEKKYENTYSASQDEEYYAPSEVETNEIVGEDGAVAVPNKRDTDFEYEKKDVDYMDFFSSIANNEQSQPAQTQQTKQNVSDVAGKDLKTRLYAEGFKLRPYSRSNSFEYYSYNFIQSNIINRDTWLIVMAIFVIEMAIFWVSLFKVIPYTYFLPITVVGIVLCFIPFVICFINPSKRSRANFNFKISILNRLMFFVELTVFMALIGFFAIGANISDIKSILMSIIIPSVIFFNLPISSVVYYLLYRSKKYHVA